MIYLFLQAISFPGFTQLEPKHGILLLPILFHMLLIFMDSTFKNRSLIIGFYSVLTSYVQLFSYGLGFLIAFWKSIIFNTGSFSAFEKTFYK